MYRYSVTGLAWSRPWASNRIAVFARSSSWQPGSPDTQSRTLMPAALSRPAIPGKSVGVAGGALVEIVPQPATIAVVATSATARRSGVHAREMGAIDPRLAPLTDARRRATRSRTRVHRPRDVSREIAASPPGAERACPPPHPPQGASPEVAPARPSAQARAEEPSKEQPRSPE